MLPRSVRDEVTAPAVGELVGNDVNVLLVTADDGGRSKGVDGVLHATVGEAGRENEDVVLAPAVGEDNLLSGSHELVHVRLKLPLASSELLGARHDAAVAANLGGLDITGANGEQIRGDGHLLLKLVHLLGSWSRGVVADGAARGHGRQDRADLEGESRLDIRSVLAGEDGASADGLALGEDVRVLLVGGLSGREPLQRRALVRGLDLDGHVDNVALGSTFGDSNVQRRAEGIRVRLELPLGGGTGDADGVDLDVLCVEDNLLALLVGLALELQGDGALEALVVKVELEVDGRVLGAPSAVVGQRRGIALAGHRGGGCEFSAAQRGGDADGDVG